MQPGSNSIAGQLSSSIVSTVLLLVYFTNLPVMLDRFSGSTTAPTLYLLVLAVAFSVGFVRYRNTISMTRYSYVIWCLAMCTIILLTLCRMYFFQFPPENIAELTDQFQRALLTLSFAILVYFTKRSHYTVPIVIVAAVAPSIIIFEFFNPDLLSEATEFTKNSAEKVRVSGFWDNENAAAEVAVLCIVLASRHARKLTLMALYTAAFFAIVFTGSRAGMVGITVIGAMLLAQRKLPLLILAAPIALALSFPSAIVLVEDMIEASGRDRGTSDFLNRVTYFFNDEDEDHSQEARTEVAMGGLQAAIQRPVIGHAIQYIDESHEAGPHNLLIDLFYQFGLPGVFIWAWMGYLLYKRNQNILSNPELFCFVWFSMFNHNLLEYNWWYIFLALTLMPDGSIRRQKSRRKRRKRKHRRTSSTQSLPRTI